MRKLRFVSAVLIVVLIIMALCSCSANDEKNEDSESQEVITKYVDREPIFRNFMTADLNGDGVDEILVHDMVDSFGGAGQYVLKVYIKSNDYSYGEIFDSDTYLEAHPNMDIQTIPIGKGVYAFQHSELEFCKEYNVPDSVYPYLFDENGNAQEPHLFRIDSFNTVEIADVDTDGCDEIVLHQYTSIGWHANYIGDCISIFKLVDGDLKLISIDIDITN